MPFVALTWTSFRNTDAYPDADDLRKISGVANAYDADAVSAEQIASAVAGCGITFSLNPGVSGGVACGLSADNPDANYTTIDYCIMYYSGDMPITVIYENGVNKWASEFQVWGGYKIIINASGQIEYYDTDTNTLLYTSLTLFADASIDVYGTRVLNAMIDAGVVKLDYLPLMGVH